MVEKVYLGKVRHNYKANNENTYLNGEEVYLSRHGWDCGWYWGFGYIGNINTHTHFDSVFLSGETDINKIFLESTFTQGEWWILRDLFIQAYALRKCAEVYRHGGHQTTRKGVTDIIKSKPMETRLNKDLANVLDKIWSIVTADRAKIKAKIKRIKSLKEQIKKRKGLLESSNNKLKELEDKQYKLVRSLE